MKLRIEVNLDSAAFEDDAAGEVARILANLARDVAIDDAAEWKLFDVNGNSCGFASVREG